MSEISAVHFEGVKISMTQSSDGIVLKLAVHPDDCPASLMTDWVGSRYMVAMAKLNDQDMPEQSASDREIERMKASCGALCRNEKFQKWVLMDTGLDINEQNTVEMIRQMLGIRSRSEFDTNAGARSAFNDMREDFQLWLKSQRA
jgi:hypothetical protein